MITATTPYGYRYYIYTLIVYIYYHYIVLFDNQTICTFLQITKSEMEHLVSKGFEWGNDIHRTYTKNHKYYATESEKLLAELTAFRNSKIQS